MLRTFLWCFVAFMGAVVELRSVLVSDAAMGFGVKKFKKKT